MPLRDKHKNLIYSRMCDRCGKTYTGHGKQFCSTNCANSDYKTVQERFWSKVNIKSENECWEWIKFKNKKGYGLFGLNAIPEGAHRVSWRFTYGDIPESLCVLHKCDNPACCNPAHLFLGTNQDNVNDRVAKNRSSDLRGSKHYRAKLTEIKVLEIRSLYKMGIRQSSIAKTYKVNQGTISNIIDKKTWTHI
jgi:hypothetical protein